MRARWGSRRPCGSVSVHQQPGAHGPIGCSCDRDVERFLLRSCIREQRGLTRFAGPEAFAMASARSRTPSKVGASRRSGRNVEPLHKAVPQTRMRGSGNVHGQSQSTQFLLTVEQRATESTHDPQTLRSPYSQAAPDLLGANPCCCLERRRHHSERDSARFHPLRGHQDRYARRGHHHVSAAHWRSKQSTVKQRRWPHERSWTQQHWINAA